MICEFENLRKHGRELKSGELVRDFKARVKLNDQTFGSANDQERLTLRYAKVRRRAKGLVKLSESSHAVIARAILEGKESLLHQSHANLK